jgi:hypothetical protein
MEVVELWPFPQGRAGTITDAFIEAAFARGLGLSRISRLRKRDYRILALAAREV